MSNQALSGIKVLDVGHHVSGPYCAKLLADYGAEVIKVENPCGGDPSRQMGPFPDDVPCDEASAFFMYLNNNKKSITLNLESNSGKSIFKKLAKQADILIENFNPGLMATLELDYKKLKEINPGLIMTSISNFGQTGPYKDYKGADIVVQALSGLIWSRGYPEREPVMAMSGQNYTEFVGGTFAATATMTAYFSRLQSGIGQQVDISLFEACTSVMPPGYSFSTWPDNHPVSPYRISFTPSVEKCKDGYVGINCLTGQQWADICTLMGMEDKTEEWMTQAERVANRKEVLDRMAPYLMARTKSEIFEECQSWRIPVATVANVEDLVNSTQFKARDYMVEVDYPVAGKQVQPGPPAKMSETPWKLSSPAPLLGQHNEEIYGKFLEYGKEDLVRLNRSGII